MKVLVCHNFYQRPGGEDNVFAAEIALLESHGNQVIRYERHNSDISAMDKTDLLKRTIWNRETVADLTQLIETERPDVMHCHNTFPLISPSTYAVARDMNVPVVQTLHNYRLVCPKAALLREGRICEDCLGKQLAWPAVVHACYRDSRSASAAVTGMLAYHWHRGTWTKAVDRYVAPSQFLKRKFVEGGFPEDTISVKPHFVGHDPGTGTGSGNYALFVGRLSPEKGIQCLLDAWTLLPDQLELKILGDGPLADTVAAAASADARIDWLGHQPATTVHTVMKEAKFLIVPSIWYEPFGLCVVEAFANGTPVIASRIGAMPEIIEHGKTGFLFDPADAAALARLTTAAFQQPEDLAQMRIAARARYDDICCADANYDMLLDIYRRAIGVRNR